MTEPQQIGNLTLVNPDPMVVEYWLRDWLREALNGLDAHMQVYQTNPGGWDQHSSHAALQRIIDDLTVYTLQLIAPVPAIQMTIRQKWILRLLHDYLVLSRSNPLIREGVGTGDTAHYAKLFTSVLKVFGEILNHIDPSAPYKDWKKNQRRA